MSKSAVAMLVLFFMVASCVAVKPALSSADDSAENSWVSKAPMQVARSGLGVAVVNGKIYAIGGSLENGFVGTNEEYDPATDTWTFKASMPTPRENFAIAVYQNKIYCIGGSSSGGYFSNESIKGVNEVYNPATDTWETKEPIPTPRRGLGANVVNGRIYLIGGYVPDSSSSTGFSFLSLNEVYDPETDSWTTKTPMPTAVSGRLSAVVDDKIYVLMPNPNLNQIYDAETDSWSLEGAPLPYFSMVYVSAGATIGVNAPKRIYIVGNSGTLVYDPINDSWTNGATIPTDREGFGVAVVNDILYAIGGFNGSYQNYPDDWIYGPSVTVCSTNERYTPFGYGTVPPEVAVVSPEDKTYAGGNVSLAFAVNKPAAWVGYSLDGQDNVTVTGNTTISRLSNGLHNITVYARDAFGNTGASEVISFSVAEESFPAVPVAAASVATVVVVGVGLLVYFRRRSHRAEARFVKKS